MADIPRSTPKERAEKAFLILNRRKGRENERGERRSSTRRRRLKKKKKKRKRGRRRSGTIDQVASFIETGRRFRGGVKRKEEAVCRYSMPIHIQPGVERHEANRK